MKKCDRCQVVFHSEERRRCLYCNALLLTVTEDDTVSFDDKSARFSSFQASQPIVKQILKEHDVADHGRTQMIVSSYFRSRNFKFMYFFSRHDYKRGKGYKRTLVQPLNATSFLMLPWLVWNVIDSFFFRMLYSGYDPQSDCKYQQKSENAPIDPDEKDYNLEYAQIIDDILKGSILRNEARHIRRALLKKKNHKRSAYDDLCSQQSGLSKFSDVFCVWISIVTIIVTVTWLTLPTLFHFVQQIPL